MASPSTKPPSGSPTRTATRLARAPLANSDSLSARRANQDGSPSPAALPVPTSWTLAVAKRTLAAAIIGAHNPHQEDNAACALRRQRHRITNSDSHDDEMQRCSCELACGWAVLSMRKAILSLMKTGHRPGSPNFGYRPMAAREMPANQVGRWNFFPICRCRRLQQRERASSSPPDSASVNHASKGVRIMISAA